MFENNTFDSNIGIHGGAIHVDLGHTGDAEQAVVQYSPFLYLRNNTFTRNMAYLEGNAIAIRGAQRQGGDLDLISNMALLQLAIVGCTFKKNYGLNVADGAAVAIDGK